MSDDDSVAKLTRVPVKLVLMGMTAVCRRWGITPTHGYRILARYREEQSVAARPSLWPTTRTRRRGHAYTLERISEEAGGYVTWERFVEKFNEEPGKNFCAKTVHNCVKEAGWGSVRTLRTLPQCKGCGEETEMGT